MTRISIADVAQRAGVSRGAVSQVINGDARKRISVPTKERIFAAMNELGYQPNRMARALSRGKTDTIGLMLSGFRNPFYVALLEHIERLLHDAGYQVLLDSSSLLQEKGSASGALRGWNVDGVLMYASPRLDLTDYLGEGARDLPVVRMGTTPGAGDWVVFDIYDGAEQAVEYALSRGYKRLATVTPLHSSTRRKQMEGRLAACFDVCHEAGLPLEVLSSCGEADDAGGFRIGLEIAARAEGKRPRVLLCHNDVVAIGVYHGLLRGGLKVPQDVAVIGFDGIREGRFLDKKLTTVEMPTEEVSRHAVSLLLSRIAQKQQNATNVESSTRFRRRKIVVPTRFIVGETT